MALFQQSVITKHLQSLDHKKLDQKWKDFSDHFGSVIIQNEIRNLKEEQYQGEFLDDLFVKILGYTKAPQPNHNLITEQKNQTNSKKADGAIVIDGKVKAVIELKGTDTTDLNKIETQAFGYKNNQAECIYVITSNFERIRFYIDNAIDFVEFNLFKLTKEDFAFLYICLSFDNIKNNIPKHLKDESVSKESQITKQLYKDYSEFKRALYNNLVEKNPTIDKLLLFKKTQKLLDRFLFIFFAEDRQLVPTNLIRRINFEWEKLREMRAPFSLYDRYKMYFDDLNKGAKVTLPAFGKKTGDAITAEFEIFAYNGGLFLPDEVLDNVQIEDDILHKHSIILSDYDFDSEVDVNILGHIFENSLNEIDEIKSEIEGNAIDKTKTKRKKDGVFYTPKYITKYIVDNTIGKLCEEKKNEFGIVDEEFAKGRKNRNKTTILKLDESLHDYRDWLLQITICDPACGSGAFLNQALEFLIKEHKYIDELESQLLGTSIGFPGAELHILENNIYGVDLNDESVEIAKLSLWLRTAQKGRKLNSLNNNIKCGNSLIDNVTVAGEKAFSWEKEFPEVFAKGGFDAIIGNPPYVLCQPSNTNEIILDYYKTYKVASYKIDLFHLFFEKAINVLSRFGVLGFITPNTYLSNKYIFPLRNFILNKTDIKIIVNHEENVFADANVDVATIILDRNKKQKNQIEFYKTVNNYFHFTGNKKQDEFLADPDNIFNIKADFGFNFKKCIPLGEIFNTYFGIQAYDRKSSISDSKVDENYLPLIDGSDIIPGRYASSSKYFNFIDSNIKSGGAKNVYEMDRVLVRQIGQVPVVGLSRKGLLASNTLYSLYPKDEKYELLYIYAILNSNFMKAFWKSKYSDGKLLFPKIKGYQIKELPIKILDSKKQEKFVDVVVQIINFNESFDLVLNKFSGYFSKQYKIAKLSGKLEKWYDLEFTDFIKELNKSIKTLGSTTLTKKDEFEWMDLFEENKKKALELKSAIDKKDKEIDQMVYELYGLTSEEIKIIEA